MPYEPAEDSFLLEREVKNYLEKLKDKKEMRILDMGSGSGIQAKICIKAGIKKSNVLCADIDDRVIAFLRKKN